MQFDIIWLLLATPLAFVLGWLASRFDFQQQRLQIGGMNRVMQLADVLEPQRQLLTLQAIILCGFLWQFVTSNFGSAGVSMNKGAVIAMTLSILVFRMLSWCKVSGIPLSAERTRPIVWLSG